MNLYDELLSVVQALSEARVDYALVGGLAVAVWGYPRATRDIDLLVLPEQLGQAKLAIAARGYSLEAEPMQFLDGMRLHRVSKVEGSLLMTVDLILVDNNLCAIWHSRQRRSVGVAELSVVSREALIAMKIAAGRPQDQADVYHLTEQDR